MSINSNYNHSLLNDRYTQYKNTWGVPPEILHSKDFTELFKLVHENGDEVGRSYVCPINGYETHPFYTGRNYFHPGSRVEMPEQGENFFSYGNCLWDQAQVIFFLDSNHSMQQLLDRRLNLVANLYQENDLFLLEGEVYRPEDGVMNRGGKTLKVNGWESEESLSKASDEVLSKKMKNETLLIERNEGLKKSIEDALPNRPEGGRLLIYAGEGHMNENLSRHLHSNNIRFITIWDREIVLSTYARIKERTDKYLKTLSNQIGGS